MIWMILEWSDHEGWENLCFNYIILECVAYQEIILYIFNVAKCIVLILGFALSECQLD
jgi:hypothetical protein